MKTGTMIVIAAVLGGGGYFGWQYFARRTALERLRNAGKHELYSSNRNLLADDMAWAGFPLLSAAFRQYGGLDDIPSAAQTPALLAEYGRAENVGISLD